MSFPVISSIVSQHAEEAAFLWLLRSNAIRAPHYALKDIAKLDGRVEAHLDGLRVAGEAGWELCKAGLGNEENGEIFAAAVMAFESGVESRIQAVLDVVQKTPELSAGLISALGWIAYEQVAPHIDQLLRSESPIIQRVGLAAKAVHRKDPGSGLQIMFASSDAALHARALKVVGELGRRNLASVVSSSLRAEDPSPRWWAAWSSALLGDGVAIPILQQIATHKGSYAVKAATMAVRRMPIDALHRWIKVLAENPETIRGALCAAGALGDPTSIPWLIEQMTVPVLARVAGESFTMITGVDLAYDDLDTNKPEGFEAGPTEDPEDENVEMDQDEDLPWPNPELIKKWWFTHQLEFTNGTRYLLGKPMAIDSLNHVLCIGKQRQRIAAALELAIRQPGQPLFNTSAPGFRQQALLGLKS
jgi:uncharacterized protein (TIGR02270 family)